MLNLGEMFSEQELMMLINRSGQCCFQFGLTGAYSPHSQAG
jgi:hypothetical protein